MSTQLFLTFMVGTCIGSFLNVVIYRLPIMLKNKMEGWAKETLGQMIETPENTFNLSKPASHCPQCKRAIPFYYNIPLLGFLLCRGSCTHCRWPISWRYPFIELFTPLLMMIVLYRYDFSLFGFAGCVYTAFLITLTMIDLNEYLLPDILTFPLLWLGLIVNVFIPYTHIENAVLGAIMGYGSLWLIFHTFKAITGKEGMGYGDFKMSAAIGAWLGAINLLTVFLIASVSGIIITIILMLLKKTNRNQPIPFGPFLALAGWLTLVYDFGKQGLSLF